MAIVKLGLVALGAYALGKRKAKDTTPPAPAARYEETVQQYDHGYGPPKYQQESPRYEETPQQHRYPADTKQ